MREGEYVDVVFIYVSQGTVMILAFGLKSEGVNSAAQGVKTALCVFHNFAVMEERVSIGKANFLELNFRS